MKKLFTFFAVLAMATSLTAQTPKENILKDWERARAYTKEYLDAMPESGYALKPTKEMRSFAGQMLHIADANYGIVGTATKVAPTAKDLEKSNDVAKASVTEKVLASYDFAINAIKNYPDAKWAEMIKLFNRFDVTRGQVIDKAFEHQTHHRGQTTVYIRMAGATPPAEKLF
ncbi:DinB family protein [Aquirufa sp.]|uniref:DinB family protein n=1 Tax=Aquirufa sp. TaxID=2676249 RepID=UPI0037839D04